MSTDDQPTLFCLGHSAELLEAMKAIIASRATGPDGQNTSRQTQYQSVLRDAFRRALSEAERTGAEPNPDCATLAKTLHV